MVDDVPYDLSRVTLLRSSGQTAPEPGTTPVGPTGSSQPGVVPGTAIGPSATGPIGAAQLKFLPDKMGQVLGSLLQ